MTSFHILSVARLVYLHRESADERYHYLEPTTAHIHLDLGISSKVTHLQVGSVPDLSNLHLDSVNKRRQFQQPSVQTLASPCHTTQDDRRRLLPNFFAIHPSPKFGRRKPLSLRTSHLNFNIPPRQERISPALRYGMIPFNSSRMSKQTAKSPHRPS
jgi:hypothetical protein